MSRRALRAAVAEAVLTNPRLHQHTKLPTWSQKIDTYAMPAWGVVTPLEQDERLDKDTLERTIQVVIGIKREGADELDDEIDADADAMEKAANAALKAVAFDAEIEETRISFSGEGKKRIGAAQLTFGCVVHTDITDPA